MSIKPFDQKHILLGVTGSIAAYKAAELASKLTQAGALVDVILTEAAARFVAPLTFQSVTGRHCYTDADLWGTQGHVTHISLARQADMLVVAPASAQTMARMAHGLGDNLLSLMALAFGAGDAVHPLLIAPAMDAGMFMHLATQQNLNTLQQRGANVIGPESGHLASGLVARGRMSEPADIFGRIRYLLSRRGPLEGKKVVVTAGGTQEPVDPVRVLTNRSSGKQGYALAQAALDAGAQVTLIAAPVTLPVPHGAEYRVVETASQMEQAVLDACRTADVLLMVAAVADFRPAQVALQKIKKGGGAPVITLEPTADILSEVAQQRQQTGLPRVVVGFAAESEELLANAQAKLHAKSLDLIAANNITEPGSGFSGDTNRVTLLFSSGEVELLPSMSKTEVAEKIVEKVINLVKISLDADNTEEHG
jgi:phosphopantothenoylcysteine decarboxylase/phosphopantothenate--cysteine ligase